MSDAAELTGAVQAWLLSTPDLDRDAFLRRVAANALAITERERGLGPAAQAAATARRQALPGSPESEAELAEAIRSGALDARDPAVFDHLRRTVLDGLAVDQPSYRHGLT